MDKSKVKKIRRPQKLVGDYGFLHVRVATELRGQFIEYCREKGVGASEVVREVIGAVLDGSWAPPALKKPAREPEKRRAKKTSAPQESGPAPAPATTKTTRKKTRG